MYGMIPKKRGLFGNVPIPTATPGIGGEARSPLDPQMSAVQPQMAQQQGQAPKSGFFGSGGAGRAIAGTVGDFLLQNAEMAPIYQPQMQQQAQLQAQALRDASQRAAGLEDYKTKAGIDAQYAAPKDPYRWRNNNGDLMEMGPEGPRTAYDDPKDKTEWIRTVDPLTGAVTMMPSPGGGFGGGADAPDILPPDFDFGDGGPASQAPGTFSELFAKYAR